ncbi:DNA polymerase III subunit gamma/tau [Caldovatus aquaticus]|uniref:DNA polymerase III subunit gamma/tau n=1 Tax=Caldovatus aquaticus TaxID=2865671 RepID=A0ABS7F3Z3_9PROT|nr:DNA polymerase III subunit gamma/tau [Caldovatus aquaticus]MBW8270214.1 DNA polymerase III subunit gamma/tau [Caldovatus aquaticus]
MAAADQTLFGSDASAADGVAPAAEEGLPEPPPPAGPGLFDAPAAAPPPQADGAPVRAAAAPPAPAPRAELGAAAYRVLARKYRPTTFAELIGQEALVRTLRNAFAQNRVPHAFLLTGVRGVGKTTTARIVARALNCIGPDGEGGPTVDPCGVCPECRAILADRHPDVVELDAASNNSVDDVRELRETLRYRPVQGRFKVLILDEVHMLSGAAFNALLKTLEEPPPQVKFMLATTELRKVPLTIRSRCQTHYLRRVPQAELRAHFARVLEKEGVAAEPEAVAMIARAADGSVRDGLSLLDQAIALAGAGGAVTAEAVRDMLGLADRGLVLDLFEALMGGDVAGALGLMDRAHERGADPLVVLSDLAELTHLLSRMRAVPALREDPSLPEAERARGAALAAKLSVPVLARAWQMLLKGIAEVQQEGVDRRAAAEMVLIRLAHAADLPTPGELVRRLTEGGTAPAVPAPPRPGAPGGGLRAVAGGAVAHRAAEPVASAAPLPGTFREVVALASGKRPMLHAYLLHSVHLVRFAPGRIEIRVEPSAPRDLAAQLAQMLQEETGARWTVALSNAEGEPTLAEQGRAAEAERRELARSHPLVQAILAAFPGATIEAVRDASTDAYGLPAAPALAARTADAADAPAEDDAGDIVPPEAEPGDLDDDLSPDEGYPAP